MQETIKPVKFTKLRWKEELAEEYVTSLPEVPAVDGPNDIETLYSFLLSAIRCAANKSGMTITYSVPKFSRDKVWFDQECRDAAKIKKSALNACKTMGFSEDRLRNYLNAKKAYKSTITQKKKDYFSSITEKLASPKNSAIFWATVNKFRQPGSNLSSIICKELWESFYNEALDQHRDPMIDIPPSEVQPIQITLDELNSALKKMKRGKAPGTDGISSEFFKFLSEN